MTSPHYLRIVVLGCLAAAWGGGSQPSLFPSSGDVGETPVKGSTAFDSATGAYRITGGGENIWAAKDAFQYAWKQMSGDLALTADIRFVGAGAMPHRKAALMIRQSLAPDAAYADVAVHGAGLTSLQFRPAAGALTQEIQSDLNGPVRLRLERRGNLFTAYAGAPGGPLKAFGPATVVLQDPVYVGLAVCSHKADVLETAVFSNVTLGPLAAARPRYSSRISIYDLRDHSVRTLFQDGEIWEAPNWSRDGKYLLTNSGGRLYRLPVDGGEPQALALDASLRCNNDHDLSRDGRRLGISASTAESHGSQVYVAGADGSNVRRLVATVPSYFHGWSPDGRYLAFVGQRNGHFNLFRVPVAGGEEQRLTSQPAYDDGPDYSPDGRWIYFNSDRSGGWDIWRMPAAGAGPGDAKAQRVTSDELEDWFPHPSPDGKWLIFLSFPKGTAGHNDKLPGVQIRMLPLPGARLKPEAPKVLTTFFGGQGTINVNSWSPESQRFAFVIYEPLAEGAAK